MTSVRANDEGDVGRYASAWVMAAGACVGIASFVYYYAQRLTTAHYDAKAHLVVARRIVDSISPGYAQMGADWLPLIHLIYLPFVMSDSQYRSAVFPSLISVVSFALSGWLVFRITAQSTESKAAGVFAAAILLGNANLEYLQSCPLTEPLSIVLLLLTTESLLRWRAHSGDSLPWETAIWATLGALCRYEGWCVFCGILLLLAYDCWTGWISRGRAVRIGAVYLSVFAAPMLAHFGYIYMRLGDSFFQRVARGSAAPYLTYKRPALSVLYHLGELAQVSAVVPLLAALAGVVFVLARRTRVRQFLPLFVLWIPSLMNIAALYWGLIYRVRYSVLLVPAIAVFSALLLTEASRKRVLVAGCLVIMAMPWLSWNFPREWRYHSFSPGPGMMVLPALALILLFVAMVKNQNLWSLLVLCVMAMQLPVLQGEARPILEETGEHAFIEPERQEVLSYLHAHYDGSGILIDMSKLAPLVYDSGFSLKNFVYNEGGDPRWNQALRAPETEVGWLCAERGDTIWEWLQIDHRKSSEYSLALRTENFMLYRLKTTLNGSSLRVGPIR